MFGAGPEIAEVHKGEKVITKIASTFDPDDTTPIRTMTDTLRKIEEPVWAHIFEEDGVVKTAVKDAGFKKIGTKVSTFSDIVGVYYKGGRKFIPVPETENINSYTWNGADFLTNGYAKMHAWCNHIGNRVKNQYSNFVNLTSRNYLVNNELDKNNRIKMIIHSMNFQKI